jgi:fatty acid-binding protein DegV
MSHFKFRLATMLDIKPIIRMMGGEAKLDLIRTRKQALKRLAEEVEKLAPFERLAFVHTHAPSESLNAVIERLNKFLPAGQGDMHAEVTPVIGAHIGPGAVGVSLVTSS